MPLNDQLPSAIATVIARSGIRIVMYHTTLNTDPIHAITEIPKSYYCICPQYVTMSKV